MTDSPATTRRPVDGHVHLWDLRRRRLPWLPPGHALRRDITADQLRRAACDPGWTFVVVQADADPDEVIDLLDLAGTEPSIAGVVGWFDLRSPDLTASIERAQDHAVEVGARLVGVRCPPADQRDPDGPADPALITGVRVAAAAGLAVDLLLRPEALTAAARLAATVPEGTFVINHLGLPDRDDDHWRRGIIALAAEPNVMIKLSGFGSLAAPAGLPDRVAEVLQLFGGRRMIFGSDWPVSSLDHPELLLRADELVPAAARPDVFGDTARRVYRLHDPAPPSPATRSDRRSEDRHAWTHPT